jgi:DNA-binding IclR family transcriptional regulator
LRQSVTQIAIVGDSPGPEEALMPMAADNASGTQNVSGVERALDVLRLFIETDSATLGVTEIAQALGLSKAVVYRVLSACRAKDFLELDEATHRYRLGVNSMYLGLAYLGRLEVAAIAREAMQQLVAATNETATLSVPVGWDRVYVDQVVPDRDVKMMVQLGRPFPLHVGASSKAMLAFFPEAELERYLADRELVSFTPLTITDAGALRRELDAIRIKGYASSVGERDPSAGSVAAPVFDRESQLIAVISVSGPAERFGSESTQAAALLLEATRNLSARLGFRP